jgi:septal ring factor EnvC (AmiA/AmiB activator)
MEYSHNPADPVHMVLAHLTERLNTQDRMIADLRSKIAETTDSSTLSKAIDDALVRLEEATAQLRERQFRNGRQRPAL